MRILPKAQRDAMFAIYGFCRVVDDIADSPGPREGRIEALDRWRDDIEALYRGEVRPATAGLPRTSSRSGSRSRAFTM
jgi:phytoene synthase